MPAKYKHTQKPGIPFYGMLLMFFVIFVTAFATAGEPIAILIPVFLLIGWGILLMSGLTVTIDEQFLRVRFGPGVFFVKFPLSDIAGCSENYRTYIWGWGIRWYLTGWLFNIAGFDSVEIILKNGKKRRIGTDEPEKLAQAIQHAIA